MKLDAKISQLVVTLSVLLLFVLLCNFAVSGVPGAKAESHFGIGYQDQDDVEQEHGEDEDEDEDDEDHELHEIEKQMMELELYGHEIEFEARQVETEVMQLELMNQIFEVVQDAEKTSFLAIMKIDELMDEEEAVEILDQCFKETKSDKTKRAIRIKLIELQSELDGQEEAANEHLRALILGQ